MQNELKINVPEGFEIDKDNSSYELIKFKPIRKKDFKEIKTFNDACIELRINPSNVFNMVDTTDEKAYKMLKIIAKAINQGWTPDWSNFNQRKYWPWFNLSSGFGFVGSYCASDRTLTPVGSRLCFENEEKCNYAGKQFIDIYRDFLK